MTKIKSVRVGVGRKVAKNYGSGQLSYEMEIDTSDVSDMNFKKAQKLQHDMGERMFQELQKDMVKIEASL